MARAYGFAVDGKLVYIKAETISQALSKFQKRFGYEATEEKNSLKCLEKSED